MAFVPYRPAVVSPEESLAAVRAFREHLDGRRTVRDFDPSLPVSREVMEEILTVAGSAPSGAHKQPWTFVAIESAELKRQIRAACEQQEKEFYESRITDEWRADLEPLGTEISHFQSLCIEFVVITYDFCSILELLNASR